MSETASGEAGRSIKQAPRHTVVGRHAIPRTARRHTECAPRFSRRLLTRTCVAVPSSLAPSPFPSAQPIFCSIRKPNFDLSVGRRAGGAQVLTSRRVRQERPPRASLEAHITAVPRNAPLDHAWFRVSEAAMSSGEYTHGKHPTGGDDSPHPLRIKRRGYPGSGGQRLSVSSSRKHLKRAPP